jgi:hypothetical protein
METRIYTKEINKCADCPELPAHFSLTDYYCRKNRHKITDISKIQKWCPLPNKKQVKRRCNKGEA